MEAWRKQKIVQILGLRKKTDGYVTNFRPFEFHIDPEDLARPSDIYRVIYQQNTKFLNDLGDRLSIVMESNNKKECEERLCKK